MPRLSLTQTFSSKYMKSGRRSSLRVDVTHQEKQVLDISLQEDFLMTQFPGVQMYGTQPPSDSSSLQ